MMSHFVLQRVYGYFQSRCTLYPKRIVEGDQNEDRVRTIISSMTVHEACGVDTIKLAMRVLGDEHAECIAACDEGKQLRLISKLETASAGTSSFAISNRGTSVCAH